MDSPWWERPCGHLSLRTGGLLVVTFDLIFVLTTFIIHSFEYHKQQHFVSITFFGVAGLQTLLVMLLLLGVLRRNLLKFQIYMFGTVLVILAEIVAFSISIYTYRTKNENSNIFFILEMICFPLYLLYKLYSFWVVRCLIIGTIRDKRLRHANSTRKESTTVRSSFLNERGSGGSGATNTSTLVRSPRHGRRGPSSNRGSVEPYHRLHGVDDIFQEIKFPQDNYIPLDKFIIESDTLKIEDEFFVKKGQLEISPGCFKQIAVKVFKQNTSAEAVRMMLLETKILTMFRDQSNIIQLLGFCTDNIHKGKMILLLEFCDKGPLECFLKENYANFHDQIRGDEIVNTNSVHSTEEESLYENVTAPTSSESPFNTRTLVLWAFQIANGMQYINSKGIVHGNLASKYIIVDNHRLRIGNFTFATQLHHCRQTGGSMNLKRIEGQLPWRYMPPEFMDELTEKNFTFMSDVWSYGVVLWEMFSLGCTPYEGMKVNEFFPKLRQGTLRLEKPHFATSHIYQILRNCWHAEPKQRPTFTELKGNFTEIIQRLG